MSRESPAKKRTTTDLRKRDRGGRKAWEPTDDERLLVQSCMASGDFTQEQIAAVLRVDHETLVKHCREELGGGRQTLNAKISGALAKKALDGDLGSIIWYEKTRRGFRDTSRHELTGADGGPIDSRSVVLEITADMSPQDAADAYQRLLG